jgi:hypothetical protein
MKNQRQDKIPANNITTFFIFNKFTVYMIMNYDGRKFNILMYV